jgi:hypothetical protein
VQQVEGDLLPGGFAAPVSHLEDRHLLLGRHLDQGAAKAGLDSPVAWEASIRPRQPK